MTSVRASFIAAAFTGLIFPASAIAGEAHELWHGGGWQVSALFDDGRFAGCYAVASYLDDTRLSLAHMASGAWYAGVQSPRAANGPYRLYVDGRPIFNGTAIAKSYGADLDVLPDWVMTAVSSGRGLTIATVRDRFDLTLNGVSAALDNVALCYEAGASPTREAHGNSSLKASYVAVKESAGAGFANMRLGPGLGWEAVAQIPAGTRSLRRTGDCRSPDDGKTNYPWCPLEYNGQRGYVSSLNLQDDDQSEATPPPPAATAAAPTRPVQPPRAEPHEPSGTTSGTGLFVSVEGHVLTNAHVAGSCRSLTVTQPDGLPVTATLIAADGTNDLALLKTAARPVVVPPITATRQGSEIAVFGFPLSGLLSKSGTFTTGTVSADSGLRENTGQFTISAPVQPGNSGGPVLDKHGNVVGVIVSKLDAVAVASAIGDVPQNVNFAIKSSTAVAFLSAHGITPLAAATNTPELSTAEIADRAKQFSVFIKCER